MLFIRQSVMRINGFGKRQTSLKQTVVFATCIVIIVVRATETTLTGPVLVIVVTLMRAGIRIAIHGEGGAFRAGWAAIVCGEGVVFRWGSIERMLKEKKTVFFVKTNTPEEKDNGKIDCFGKYLAFAHPEGADLLFIDDFTHFTIPVVCVIVEGDCGTENMAPDFV